LLSYQHPFSDEVVPSTPATPLSKSEARSLKETKEEKKKKEVLLQILLSLDFALTSVFFFFFSV